MNMTSYSIVYTCTKLFHPRGNVAEICQWHRPSYTINYERRERGLASRRTDRCSKEETPETTLNHGNAHLKKLVFDCAVDNDLPRQHPEGTQVVWRRDFVRKLKARRVSSLTRATRMSGRISHRPLYNSPQPRPSWIGRGEGARVGPTDRPPSCDLQS